MGADLRWLQGPHAIDAQLLRSESRYPTELDTQGALAAGTRPAGNAGLAEYRYSDSRWTGRLAHTRVDAGFSADLGFIGQVGYRRSDASGSRSWYGDGDAAFNKVVLSAWLQYAQFEDGALLQRQGETGLTLSGPLQSTYALNALTRTRYWA